VTRLLRRVRPRVVLTHSPADYMLDHEMTSTLARAAAFAAPVPNYLSGEEPPLPAIPHLYYCDPVEGKDPFGRPVCPQFCIDISSVIDIKEKMLACHASQRNWLLKHHGMDHYLRTMRDTSAERGRDIGVAYAEGFRQHLGHSYPQHNLIESILVH
jgi:N-acetylglucosamine malate deacetylase 1